MIELTEDDLFDIHEKLDIDCTVSNQDLCLSQQVPVVVCYDLADLEDTPYHFKQVFHHRDTQMYFERMKDICQGTIRDLFDKPYDWHFRRNEVKGILKRELQKVNPDVVKGNPMIFHFALYTTPGGADRKKDIRSPRIYFMLGVNGMIYPLFFDPYHEINPQT